MNAPRVLVVEDENLVALEICRTLKAQGYVVIGPVSTGEAAIEKAQEARPDVVLMDIRLKGSIDGVTAAAQIGDTTDTPIIFLTAHADRATLERAKIAEPFGYIVKPFSNSELHAALEMTLYKRNKIHNEAIVPHRSNNQDDEAAFRPSLDALLDRKQFLRSVELFSGLSSDELSLLSNACVTQVFKAGELLIESKSVDTPVFLVQSGRVAMIESSEEGKELIVEIVMPGDLFGLISAVNQSTTALTARVDTISTIVIVPARSFLLVLESHSCLALDFAKYIANRLRASQVFSRALAYDDASVRICSVLNALTPNSGRREGGSDSYLLDITRQDIASLTGMTVETVVRLLKALERRGVVKLGQRKKLQICNPEKLKQISQDFHSSGNGILVAN